MILFKSDIQSFEELSETPTEVVDSRRFDNMMGALLEGLHWIVDILPEQGRADAAGQYIAVERCFLQPERIAPCAANTPRSFCGALQRAAETALRNSGKFIPCQVVTISRDGRILE